MASEGGAQKYVAPSNKEKCKPDNTGYQWVQSDNPHCLEIGLTADGKAFKNKVDAKKCLKGIDLSLVFIPTSPIAGSCFEVDTLTKGAKVKHTVSTRKCRDIPKELETRLIAYEGREYCIEIDKEDLIQGYRRSVNKKECTEFTEEYRFEMGEENPFEGKCLKKSIYNGKENWSGTLIDRCKSQKTRYFWYTPEQYPSRWIKRQEKKSTTTQKLETILASKKNLIFFGKCYEIDDEKGPEVYSKAVNIKNCKIEDVKLKFFHPREYIKGGCYFVDVKTEGTKYLKRTLDKSCKDEFLKTEDEIIEENTDYSPI